MYYSCKYQLYLWTAVADVNDSIRECWLGLFQGDRDYIGFATLPEQVHRKSVKRGFDFTLMVVGESGLGKSTLVNSLFLSDLYKDRRIPDAIGKLFIICICFNGVSIAAQCIATILRPIVLPRI